MLRRRVQEGRATRELVGLNDWVYMSPLDSWLHRECSGSDARESSSTLTLYPPLVIVLPPSLTTLALPALLLARLILRAWISIVLFTRRRSRSRSARSRSSSSSTSSAPSSRTVDVGERERTLRVEEGVGERNDATSSESSEVTLSISSDEPVEARDVVDEAYEASESVEDCRTGRMRGRLVVLERDGEEAVGSEMCSWMGESSEDALRNVGERPPSRGGVAGKAKRARTSGTGDAGGDASVGEGREAGTSVAKGDGGEIAEESGST